MSLREWLQRRMTGSTTAERMNLAVQESKARIARGKCRHDCVSCDYFHTVARLTDSHELLRRVEEMLEVHLVACLSGASNSSSCR